MRKNFIKGIAAALMAAVMVSSINPTPVLAADKLTATVTKPKKNAKVSGNKIIIHTRDNVQLKVKFAGKNVTKKATYKIGNTQVAWVTDGKITARVYGETTLKIKYKNNTKKYTIVVADHNWVPHEVTTTVKKTVLRCVCGKAFPPEKKDCAKCQANNPFMKRKRWCYCKAWAHGRNHARKGESSGMWEEKKGDKLTHVDYYKCECGAKTKKL